MKYWTPGPDEYNSTIFEKYELVGKGSCLNAGKNLYSKRMRLTFRECLEAADSEPHATGFTWSMIDLECNIHGWLFLHLRNPPWTSFDCSSDGACTQIGKPTIGRQLGESEADFLPDVPHTYNTATNYTLS